MTRNPKPRPARALRVSKDWPCMAGEPIVTYITFPSGARMPYTAKMLERRKERLNAESQALFEAL